MKKLATLAAVIVLTLIISSTAFAAETWAKTYGEGLDDMAYDALLLEDGGYLLVGQSIVQFEPAMMSHLILLRLDAHGNAVWQRTHGGDRFSSGSSLIARHDGGYVIVGTIQSETGDDKDIYLLCVDSDGNEIWSRTFGTALNEFGGQIHRTSDNAFWIVGNSVDPEDIVADPSAAGYAGLAGRSNTYVVRTDEDGMEIWAQRHVSEDNVIAFGSVASSDGCIVILSCVLHYPIEDNDIRLTKIASDGRKVWSKSWTDGKLSGYALIQTSDGGYVISGVRELPDSAGRLNPDAVLIKTDANGEQLWITTYGAPDLVETAHAVAEIADGELISVGWQERDLYTWGDNILIARIDHAGTLLWEEVIPSGNHNLHARILEHSDGTYIIAGSVGERGQSFRIQLIKYAPTGEL